MPCASPCSVPLGAASLVELVAISSSMLCAGAAVGEVVAAVVGGSSSSASARWR